MRKPSKLAVILFFIVVGAAYGLTKLTSVLIQNSQIKTSTLDSTPIGNTTPDSGKFTWLFANGTATVGTGGANQGSYLGWNMYSHTAGETDFINQAGNGPGGFYWWNFNTSGQSSLPMTLDGTGNLTLGSSVTAANLNGRLTGILIGNATSATALANSPSQCGVGTGQYSIGIQANGNANCYAYPQSVASPGYFTLPNNLVIEFGNKILPSGNGDFVAFPYAFPHTVLTVIASDAGGESNPTSSAVYSASGVINPSSPQTGFYAYMKTTQGAYINGVMSWIAIGY